jgi:hypothetical protein
MNPPVPGLTVSCPGPPPGAASAACQDGRITIGTGALAVSWRHTPQGLEALGFRDETLRRDLPMTGEVFEIVLADGRRYPASELAPDGNPRQGDLTAKPDAARLAGRIPGRQVELSLRSADGRLRVLWRALAHDGGNYVRQEIEVTAARDDCVIKEIVWLDDTLPGVRAAGRVDGSPVTGDNFFCGAEDPHAVAVVEPPKQQAGAPLPAGSNKIAFRLPRNALLRHGETLVQSFVIGVAPQGQLRRAFLYYLERERAHPYRPYLHYNSWHDLHGRSLNEANCLDVIRAFGECLVKPHGVVLDGLLFDDGWDDPKTLWRFNGSFPNGFTPLAEACGKYQTHVGVWLSPFGGYDEPKQQRLAFGRQQGYETNAAGFSMAGPKYYAAFKRACVNMIRQYRVNHFKFDGMAAGMNANGGAEYVADTEAMRRLMLELRQEDPHLHINLTTGSWPSPFWLRFADSIWRQGHDMGQAGKGSNQQKWITYRDQEVFRNIVGKGSLFPLNSLMTQGVAYSRQGIAGDPTFNSAGFKDDVRAFFGSGTGLQELYIQPGKLTADDWAVLAEAAKWSRANADVLVDTHWIGGDPSKLEVYGYASWAPRKGIVMLRNPDDRPHEFALDVGAAFELPAGAAGKFQLRSPWVEDAAKPALSAESNNPLTITLKPFEILILEAQP